MREIDFSNIIRNYFQNEKTFLVLSILYHILVIFFVFILHFEYDYNVFFLLDVGSFQFDSHTLYQKSLFSLLISGIIISIDIVFLYIIQRDFPKLKLTFKKILLIELLVFVFSYYYSAFRIIFFFLSMNSLQISTLHLIQKRIELFRYILVLGFTLSIAKIFIVFFMQFLDIAMKMQ